MKRTALIMVMLMTAAAWCRAGENGAADAAPQVVSPAAQSINPGAEEQFQLARRAWLGGDRDGAWKALNQALALDPYHTGAGRLYQTIRDEERSLRQVRLVSPAPAAKPALQEDAQAAAESRRFWGNFRAFEGRTERRLGLLEKTYGEVNGNVEAVRAEVQGQKEVMMLVRNGQQRLEARTDNLMLGLVLLLFALVLLLVLTLRAVLRMRADLNGVEWKLRDQPAPRIRR